MEASFPGVGSVESLRAALTDSTAAQREEDQKEAVHEALIRAVADCVDADIPDSAIRQLAENEYQAKLHEIQLKACRCWPPWQPAWDCYALGTLTIDGLIPCDLCA